MPCFMATGTIKAGEKNNTYIGTTISVNDVDLSSVGMKTYSWAALNSPPTVTGYTFRCWILTGNTYRFAPLGYGGSTVTYYVNTAYTTPGIISAIPIYTKA